MPSALIQPIAIRGNWELLRNNFLPLPFGTSIEVEFLPPIEPGSRDAEEVLGEAERLIRRSVEQPVAENVDPAAV
jgi:1-acyl-sn-glycerol-3-phosphate acyltransferase